MSWSALENLARPRAAVLLVGDELTHGDVVDENGPFLLRALRARGVQVDELRMVGDEVGALARTVGELRARCDALFVAGGIGPTHDDVTLEAVATAFGVPLELHPPLVARVRDYFGADASPGALRLARVPRGAEVRLGKLLLLPTLTVGNVAVLPGVPRLLRATFLELMGERAVGPPFVRHDFRLVAEEPELVGPLAALQAGHPAVQLGCYPNFEVAPREVRLSVQGRDESAVRAAVAALLRRWPHAHPLLAP